MFHYFFTSRVPIIYFKSSEVMNNGLLDLIITSQKGNQDNLNYKAFLSEKMVLIVGSETESYEVKELLQNGAIDQALKILKRQLWYSTAADIGVDEKILVTKFRGASGI